MKPLATPPCWATRLLEFFCAPHLLEEVRGDLEERFQRRAALFGERVARRQYVAEVLGFLRPFALKRKPDDSHQPFSINSLMLRNYFKIAWRNLRKQPGFAAINVIGLAIGLTACLLTGLFVYDELRYDRFHENADRIVRVELRGKLNGEAIHEANVMAPVAATLQRRIPEVEATVRLYTAGTPRLEYGNQVFRDSRVVFADSTLFRVFSFPLRQGRYAGADDKTALLRPNTLVVSESLGRKLFGSGNPVGKVVALFGDKVAYTVTGVMADIPAHSHIRADAFAAMAGVEAARSDSWMQSNFFTYLLLPAGYDRPALDARMKPISETYLLPPFAKFLNMSVPALLRKGDYLNLSLQPLTDIRLRSDATPNSEIEPGGDIRYVYLFGAIAVFMLLLACINFTNLSTAGAAKRTKEVGIRKVLGSARGRLIRQFLTESVLLTAVALLLAVGLAWAILPVFNELAGKTIRISPMELPWLLAAMAGFGLLVSGLAGSYPAFFLSSMRPIAVLKNSKTPAGRGRTTLRSGLVVFQFFVSISLMIATVVVYQQLRYIQTTKLGYDKTQVLILEGTGVLEQNQHVLARQLAQDSRVKHVSVSGFLPNDRYYTGLISMQPEGQEAKLRRLTYFGVDDQYLPTLGMNVVAGRNFSAGFPSDSSGVLINEAAARLFGWTKSPLGHTLTDPAGPQNGGRASNYRVIGVVKDFHFRSLHEEIAPMVMLLNKNGGSVLLKTRAADVAPLLADIGKRWAAFGTGEPFRYAFLDDAYQAMHKAETSTGRVLAVFAGLTVFIACLGLFGLATFMAEQRTKEIGVRKVLGASVASIVTLLSKDFLKLVFVAMVLAAPIAAYAMHRWLQGFAYKISLEWWVFALAGLLAVGIALLTVSFQSIKAALMNPVKSLRSE